MPINGKVAPLASLVLMPISSSASKVLGLWRRVKIVLKLLPITAPPRAVICCAAVTIPSSWSILTPAVAAVLPTRLKASAKSAPLTANAWSTAINLLVT